MYSFHVCNVPQPPVLIPINLQTNEQHEQNEMKVIWEHAIAIAMNTMCRINAIYFCWYWYLGLSILNTHLSNWEN